jgi:hypothetical protein
VGLPILGDRLYGGGSACRAYLHASAMFLNLKDIGITTDDEKGTEMGDSDVVLISDPPFDHLWNHRASESASVAKEIFRDAMRKHCDCPQLVKHILAK